jgi:hypothetical protein
VAAPGVGEQHVGQVANGDPNRYRPADSTHIGSIAYPKRRLIPVRGHGPGGLLEIRCIASNQVYRQR